MHKSNGTIEECRSSVLQLIGKNITVKHNKGRNKIVTYDGSITEAYNGIFVMKIDNDIIDRLSFSYKDILCGDIKIKEKN